MSTQRRSYTYGTPVQNSFPHISPPPPSLISPPSEEKQSRRASALSHRIWFLFCVILFIFLCTHILAPAPVKTPPRAYTNANLIPENYLNASNDPDFAPFQFCPIYGPGDAIAERYGAHTLAKTKLHLGSGARVQRIIRKALAGQPVTISVLGGSVSACHGAGEDPISPTCYPSRFFQWWNEIFPNPASELTNGAVRHTDSAYLSFCHGLHIPDHTDLVVLELDSDDQNEHRWMEHFELLVRSILLRPDAPAVVILGHFCPQSQITHGFAGPEFLHSIVAQFYDVPHISTKPMLYSKYLHSPSAMDTYYADPVLANPNGHTLLADILISYIQSQVCAAWASVTGVGFEVPISPSNRLLKGDSKGLFGGVGVRKDVPLDVAEKRPRVGLENNDEALTREYAHLGVPPALLSARPDDIEHFREVRPFCLSANDLINPLPPSLFYGSGWHAFHPPNGAAFTEGGNSAHYWYSTLPTSRLRVPMKMGSGDVAIYYWREDEHTNENVESSVRCWVDDNIRGAVQVRNVGGGRPGPAIHMIDHYVSQGSHYIECELLGEEGRGVPAFKILGIFST